MLSFPQSRRIFVARQPADMRRGVDALSSIVQSEFGQDPYAGDVFVFVSRDRRRVKVLAWDVSGFWLCAKRLEGGTYAIPRQVLESSEASVRMTPAQIALLLEGIDVREARYHRHYRRERDKNPTTPEPCTRT